MRHYEHETIERIIESGETSEYKAKIKITPAEEETSAGRVTATKWIDVTPAQLQRILEALETDYPNTPQTR